MATKSWLNHYAANGTGQVVNPVGRLDVFFECWRAKVGPWPGP